MPEAVTMIAGEVYPASVAWDLTTGPTRWSSSDPAACTVEPVPPEPPVEGAEPVPDLKLNAMVTAVENSSPAFRTCEIRAHATVNDEASEFHGQELVSAFHVTVVPAVGGDITLAAAAPPPPPPPPGTFSTYRRKPQ